MKVRAMSLVGLLAGIPAPAAAAPGHELTYSVGEARAYTYRVALRKEAIEVASAARRCDPATDPYSCDPGRYNRVPNCRHPLALGKDGKGPDIAAPPGALGTSGGAGDAIGQAEEPHLSSAITLNEMLTLGTLIRNHGGRSAVGLASSGYLDLAGRTDPEAHTESDAYTERRADVEERCIGDPDEGFRHFLSRSFRRGETYHLAECAASGCTFRHLGSVAESASAKTTVHLWQRSARIHGVLSAEVEDLSWGGGAVTVGAVRTLVVFSSDGTERGLRWRVTTTVTGMAAEGRSLALQPGTSVPVGEASIGAAAPYVRAAGDGRSLRIVAPGLMIAGPEQTVFVGGVELDVAGLGRVQLRSPRATAPERVGADRPDEPAGPGAPAHGSTVRGPAAGVLAPALGTSPATVPVTTPASAPTFLLHRPVTGAWAAGTIFGLGLAGALAITGRWARRFPWWRTAVRSSPLRGISRVARAFLRT